MCSSIRTIGLTGAVSPPRDAGTAFAPPASTSTTDASSFFVVPTGPSSTSRDESALSRSAITATPSPPLRSLSADRADDDGDAPSVAPRSAAIARCASSARVHRAKMTEKARKTAICMAPGGGKAPGSSSTTSPDESAMCGR